MIAVRQIGRVRRFPGVPDRCSIVLFKVFMRLGFVNTDQWLEVRSLPCFWPAMSIEPRDIDRCERKLKLVLTGFPSQLFFLLEAGVFQFLHQRIHIHGTGVGGNVAGQGDPRL